jgi:hypothetical protein
MTSCRVSWGHISGCGFSGRGYQIFKDGQPVTLILLDQNRAWAAYRRDQKASRS